jgi:uncharacterized protein YbaP (TraB family)
MTAGPTGWERRRAYEAALEWMAAFGFAFLVAVLCSCVSPPDPTQATVRVSDELPETISREATPPFYTVTGGTGATLQILGTIHVGPDEGWIFPADIDRAIAEADEFVIEVDLRDMSEDTASDSLMRHGVLPGQTPLSTLISPETARALEQNDELLASVGAPAHVREAMQPWFIMMLLMETTVAQSGLQSDQAVEEGLVARLGDRNLISLESLDQQLSFFGGLPIEIQEVLLRQTLDEWDQAQDDLGTLVGAWQTADGPSLLRIAFDDVEDVPAMRQFYDVMLADRNERWVPTFAELLDDPGRADTTVLVGVGALHLVGPDGVPKRLRDAGYSVEARK